MSTLTHTYTRTSNAIDFADPYKKCLRCDAWVDGVLDAPGPAIVLPCEHESGYRDACPSWSPVTGCGCAEFTAQHPDQPIVHEMRTPTADRKVY